MPPKITIENYLDFKPSELIAQSLIDLDNVIASGLALNMNAWFGAYRNTEDFAITKCFVCLGAAVMYGMIPSIKQKLNERKYEQCESVMDEIAGAKEIAMLFDDIRCGLKTSTANRISSLYGLLPGQYAQLNRVIENWKAMNFYGALDDTSVSNLRRSIESLVEVLKGVDL